MQTRFKVNVSVVTIAVISATLFGCKKDTSSVIQPPPPSTATSTVTAEPQPDPESLFFEALDKAYNTANELLEQAQTNEAIQVFEDLYADARWEEWSNRLFAEKVRFHLYLGNTEIARELTLDACANGPTDNGIAGLQLFIPYIHETDSLEAAYTLADQIEALPGLAPELTQYIIEWRFFTALAAPNMEVASQTLTKMFTTFPAETANRIFGNAIDSLLNNKREADTSALLAIASTIADPTPGLTQIITITKVRLAALKADWANTTALFSDASATLDDTPLRRLLIQIMSTMRRAKAFDAVDQCVEQILYNQADKKASVSQAARFWIESAMATDHSALAERFTKLIDELKIDAAEIGPLYTRYFYDLINDVALVGKLLPIADKLIATTDTETAKTIKTMRLDGAFVTDDFDKAISYLEAGIPDRDTPWHNMALAKVRAHNSLKNNKPREAVKYFREFMTYIDDVKEDDTIDPSTGIQHSRDMLRGRNAKRIAEILASIPDAEAATGAMKEAADYFKKALAETKDEETRAVIIAEAGNLLE
ncbi:MAG: hypothetical protein GX230_11355 [Lentisphaerae bacterium]|nr:hypothetical protein [Lentisphaerota bacterium]